MGSPLVCSGVSVAKSLVFCAVLCILLSVLMSVFCLHHYQGYHDRNHMLWNIVSTDRYILHIQMCWNVHIVNFMSGLTRKLLNQRCLLINSLQTFYGDHHDLVNRCEISVSQITTFIFRLSYSRYILHIQMCWNVHIVNFMCISRYYNVCKETCAI
jgi:hypothetical protein